MKLSIILFIICVTNKLFGISPEKFKVHVTLSIVNMNHQNSRTPYGLFKFSFHPLEQLLYQYYNNNI